MATRSNAHDTAQIQIELLKRLSRTAPQDAKTLHEQLEAAGIVRSRRTIERTLKQMSDTGDISCVQESKPFSYRLPANSKVLAVGTLSAQESLLLDLAKKHMERLLPESMKRSLQALFDQAQRNLRSNLSGTREREWLNKVRSIDSGMPLLAPEIAKGVLEQVSEALYANCWLDLDYRNAKGETKVADVMPLGLFQQGPGLYVVVRFKGHENEVSLALHRIKRARNTTLPFERPRDFDLEKFDRDGQAHFGLGRKIRLSFRIAKERGQHLTEMRLAEDQTITETEDGQLQVSATVPDTLKLTWWLDGFRDAVSDVRREVVVDSPAGPERSPA